MTGRLTRTAGVLGLTAALTFGGYPGMAVAEMVGTEALVESPRMERVERLQALISRDDVAGKLVDLGVDPEHARERVAALTEAELARMEARMDALPAGAGAIEAIGIVFVILIILELLGVTNIFTAV